MLLLGAESANFPGRSRVQPLGFRVLGLYLGFRVQGLGFRVEGLGSRVQPVGFMVLGLWFLGFSV